MPFYHIPGPGAAQAAHGLPPPRRRTVQRAADGQRGLHRPVVAALPYPPADDDQERAAPQETPGYEKDDDLALRHRHFRTRTLEPKGGSPTLDRIPLLFNADIAMLWSEPDVHDEHFFRNARADEVVYVAEGSGTLESQFGYLAIKPGDYVVLPRGIMHRWPASPGRPSC